MEIDVSGLWRFVFDDDVESPVDVPNGVTYEGLNYLLNAAFRGGPQYSFYVGYIDWQNGGANPAFSPNDTYSSHSGWLESWLGSSPGARASWAPNPAAGGVMQNTGQTVTPPAGAQTILGVFLTSSNANSSSGILYSTAVMSAPQLFATATYAYGVRLTPKV